MDRLAAMAVLIQATKAGSLSAAGRRLGMPLATVSRHISELEAHLGTRLLIRSSRQLALTDAGQSYIVACKRILEEVEEAERAASGEYRAPKGDLTITAPIMFGRLHVLPVAIAFLEAFPEVNIRIMQSDRMIDLLEDHIDLAVRIADLPDSSLVATRVGSIRRIVCGSPGYFERRGMPQNPSDLRAHDCVTFEGLTSPDGWKFRIGKTETSVAIHSRLVVNTAEAAIDAAIAGVGMTCALSYQIGDTVQTGSLLVALQNYELDPWPVNLVYLGHQPLPQKLRAFLDFAAPQLRARLQF
jgi:DNA-binding transcriptional LysR family regulator